MNTIYSHISKRLSAYKHVDMVVMCKKMWRNNQQLGEDDVSV